MPRWRVGGAEVAGSECIGGGSGGGSSLLECAEWTKWRGGLVHTGAMARVASKSGKESKREQHARRLMEAMESILECEMRPRTEDVHAMLSLSPPEMRSLMWLARRGKTVMSDFAQGVNVPLSTATRIVNRMVKKGIVVRQRSEQDRRIVEVDLSPVAYEHKQRFVEYRRAALMRVLGGLTVEESETVLSLLEKGLRLCAAAGVVDAKKN